MRIWIVALALSAVFGAPLADGASAETWRMSTKQPADSPEGKVFQHFADQVSARSGGAFEMKVFPSEQLGKSDAVLEQLQRGTIHVFAEDVANLAKWAPELRWVIAPFLFDDRAHWTRFMASDTVRGWLEKVRAEAGITLIGDATSICRGPYRVMVSDVAVANVADVGRIKLRMYPDELAVAAWRHLGAEVRVLAWTDVYESIRNGVVDAVSSPVVLVEAMRFHEVAPHIIRHDEFHQGIALMTNDAAVKKLPPAEAAALGRAFKDTADFACSALEAVADESLVRLRSKGVSFTALDPAAFAAKMADFYAAKARAGEMPAGFLEAIAATR